MYKANLEEDPNMSMRSMRQIISKNMGIGESTVHRTINEYKESCTVTSPKRKRVRENVFHLYDDFSRNAVGRHVHNIWFRREIPTIDKKVSDDKSLPAISRTNLFKLIKDLDFRYCKRSRNSALTEKNEIVVWRRRYLRAIREYREQGRHIYYLDETWVNAGECPNKVCVDSTIQSHRDAFLKGLTAGAPAPSGKGKRHIVLHIGSEDGFVPGGLLCFESKKNSWDYHDEKNGQTFYDWMENILPQLRDNCVIVTDSVNHSVKKDKSPTSSTRKAEIIKWLEDKGEVVDYTMVIPELLEIVKRIKPLHNKYVIDELAKASNKTILRLPPYHCELNPIELAWSSIKNQGIERVDQVMWKNFIQYTIKEEKFFWEIDNIVDEVLAAETSNLTLTITGDTSSDSESESD
ncbi:uncharacterized protein LOC111038053 [Myzus persicae]|uniref:uncharacterized protein LOC111038053 n=1 Tax=Myzus persicae TaxID=13164 RepID=UPI000B930030|nr:uncharacterized protein LOC111038053 [Myzus persicae]